MPLDWKPIETAPHDRPIMAYVPGGMWSGGNPYLVVDWAGGDEEGGFLTVDDTCAVNPTHWAEINPPEGVSDHIGTAR